MNTTNPPGRDGRTRRRSRWLGAAAVGAMAAALMAPLGTAAQADPSEAPVVDYEFTQTTGASVPDAAGAEPAEVQNAADDQWTGTSLHLTGGDEDEDGNWVRLPEDLLGEASSATITTEVKIDET